MKETGKRKEWVKNVAIIFLAVLLVLTFFSNTIKNYSLPEVAAQYTSSGTITNKIRGNGTVEASDPYSVVYKAERKVASVKVSVGDTVEKGDVLYELEEGESEALKVARQTLSELEAAYEKSLILGSVSKDLTSKVENGQMGSASELQDKVNAAKKKAENAKAYVEQLQREQQAAGSSTSNSVNDELDKQIANIKTIREACVERRDANIEAVSKSADEYRKALDLEYGTPDASTGEPEAKNTYPRVIWLCLRSLESDITLTDDEKNSIVVVKYDFIQKHGSSLDAYLSAMNLIKDLSKKVPNILTDTITIGVSTTTYTDRILNDPVLNQRRKAYEDAQVSVNTENQNIVNIDNQITIWEGQKTTTSTTNDYTTKIADAQAAYEKAQKTYDDLVSEINTSYDLLGQLSKIEAQKEVVRELESDQGNSEITAPVSGTVLSINYVAGETINQGSTVSTIQVAGKGFTMSVTIPAEKARLIAVGDEAEITNSWWYSDVHARIMAIKPDPSNPSKSKLVVFELEGDVTAGQSLSFSVGRKSANYDNIVPNSAIHEDSNGKFIYKINSKSTPLGNRYIIERIDVTVLASDDTQSAVSGALEGWDYIVTTTSKPIDNGTEVRLKD